MLQSEGGVQRIWRFTIWCTTAEYLAHHSGMYFMRMQTWLFDATSSVRSFFTNDVNAYKAFELNALNEDLFVARRKGQSEVHVWCKANQVSFVSNNESMHLFALIGGESPNFKLLGVPVDTALNMKDAVVEIVGAATWKIGPF